MLTEKLFEPTWEDIIEPERSIPFDELEVKVVQGESLNIGFDRPELQKEVFDYWHQKVTHGIKIRLDGLNEAKSKGDQKGFDILMRFAAGNNLKHRLSRAILDGETLHLALGCTDYMHFVGTNERSINDLDFRARLIQAGIEDSADPQKYFADPLAVCAVIYGQDPKTGEVYVPVGFRSDKVMIYPNVYHIFGGLTNVDKKDATNVGLGINSRRELKEEMGLTDEEMGVGFFNGLVRQGLSRIPEVICQIPVYVSKEELMKRWSTSAPGKFEHRNIEIYNLEQLSGFLKENGPDMVPSGAAALVKFLENYG